AAAARYRRLRHVARGLSGLLRRAGLDEVLEELALAGPLAQLGDAAIAEACRLEERDEDLLRGQHHVVELGVADHVIEARAGTEDAREAPGVQGHVLEVTVHVVAEQRLA